MNERNSFIFYKSFHDAIKTADDSTQLELYKAICEYALFGNKPNLQGLAAGFWALIEPQITANWKRFNNGTKGGKYGELGGNPNFTKGNPNPYYQIDKFSGKNNPTDTPKDNPEVIANGGDMKKANGKETQPRFSKPTIEEVKAYCLERKNNVDPDQWYSYYESNGWKVGKNTMKDWKAAIRTWEKHNFDSGSSKMPTADKLILSNNDANKYKDDQTW